MRKILVSFAIFWLLSFFPVRAQESNIEKVQSFHSDINILQNGEVQIHEKIVYDFGSQEKHGIYRKLEQQRTNKKGEKFKLEITSIEVKDAEGRSIPFKVTDEGEQVVIRIGDSNRLISGVHDYDISYIERGAITYFSDHDELYWQITGTNWEVPIDSITAVIKVEGVTGNPDQFKTKCFAGSDSSEASDCVAGFDQNYYTYTSNKVLGPGEGFTVVAGFPKGIGVLEPKKVVNYWETIWGLMTLALIGVAALLWYVIYPLWLPIQWFLYGRDPRVSPGEATAWYDPPITKSGRKLSPAETGALIDEHVGPQEIVALVVDLARRGYLQIIEKGKNDFVLKSITSIVKKDKLEPYEKSFLEDLFNDKKEIRIKDEDLTSTVENVNKKLYQKLLDEGYFPENPDNIRKFYMGMTAAGAATFNFLLLITGSIFGRIMPKKTLSGVAATKIARSLKNFLNSQDRQLEFQAQNQMFFEKLLPFAVAFGVEKVWAKRFENIELKQPDWYVGQNSGVFNSVAFSNSLHSSVGVVNKSATPTSSSSGFSSGFSGGSVGGGGGGGGGGSW